MAAVLRSISLLGIVEQVMNLETIIIGANRTAAYRRDHAVMDLSRHPAGVHAAQPGYKLRERLTALLRAIAMDNPQRGVAYRWRLYAQPGWCVPVMEWRAIWDDFRNWMLGAA